MKFAIQTYMYNILIPMAAKKHYVQPHLCYGTPVNTLVPNKYCISHFISDVCDYWVWMYSQLV